MHVARKPSDLLREYIKLEHPITWLHNHGWCPVDMVAHVFGDC